MIDDPIIEELHRYRETHAAKFNFDASAILADLLERQKSSPSYFVDRSAIKVESKSYQNGKELVGTDI